MSKPSPPSWQDLPLPFLELVLDCLPVPDYLRFPAICSSWRKVHHSHLRHTASPRHHRHMPWLVYSKDTEYSLPLSHKRLFFSPSEKRYYHIPLPESSYDFEVSKHGWLLLVDPKKLSLLVVNPFTGCQTRIYFPPSFYHYPDAVGDMYLSPSDPNCVILYQFNNIWGHPEYFVYRFKEETWTRLPNLCDRKTYGGTICGGKFYWLVEDGGKDLVEVVVEAKSNPIVSCHDMSVVEPISIPRPGCNLSSFLVECEGHILLTMFIWTASLDVMMFRIFKAELGDKVWVRLESLGDYVLFLCFRGNSFSLPAAQIQGPGNRIFFNFNQGPVVEYDYGTHGSVKHDRKCLGKHASKWILPSLC